MSDTKWAKGPWRLIGRYEATPAEWQNMQVVCSEVGADDLYVVAAWTHDIGDDGRDATAHLISAAPELYEALREASIELLCCARNARAAAESDPAWDGVAEIIDERRAQCEAALAKARGEAS